MRESDEDEEKPLQRRCSQGFARKAYPVRYVDRANPRTPSLKRFFLILVTLPHESSGFAYFLADKFSPE